MQIGMIGLGRMGGNMAERLARRGHDVVAYDRSADAVRETVSRFDSLSGAGSLEELVAQLATPRVVWLMLPAGDPTGHTLRELASMLAAGDIVVDGGNSRYSDTMQRAVELAAHGIELVDVGTSGGIWGLTEGYCLMVGGQATSVARLTPAFQALAPAPYRGWAHVGPSGAGHFVKMIHNGIEYGLMQAYAEGFAVLHRKTELELDVAQIAELWRHGSVVRSWLLDLAARALHGDPALSAIAPYVADSGEGRWSVAEAIDLDVPAPVMTHALIARLRSRDEESFADRMLAALRAEFGGHAVKAADS